MGRVRFCDIVRVHKSFEIKTSHVVQAKNIVMTSWCSFYRYKKRSFRDVTQRMENDLKALLLTLSNISSAAAKREVSPLVVGLFLVHFG